MKMLITMCLLFIAVIQANAQKALPANLKDTMTVVGNDLKRMTAQAKDANMNVDSTAAANEIAQFLQHAKNFTPDAIKNEAQKSQYLQALDQSAQIAQQLAQAFQTNDNAKAIELIKSIGQVRRESHSNFKD